MTEDLDSILRSIERPSPPSTPASKESCPTEGQDAGSAPSGPRVLHMDTAPRDLASDAVDSLFDRCPSYRRIKNEQPWHRLAMWMLLRGQTVKEVALALGKSENAVYVLRKQPWFQEAFCAIAAELGKDAVQTLLQGEVLETVERTITLAKTAESDAVKLAANKEILDRFLGKSTVKVEQKMSGAVDHVVYDAQKLLEEERRLTEQLRARGIGTN